MTKANDLKGFKTYFCVMQSRKCLFQEFLPYILSIGLLLCRSFVEKYILPTKKTCHSQTIFSIITNQYKTRRKDGNALFNDALNDGIRHMVKDHSDSERGNPLLPHGLLFPISSKGSFICITPQTG